MTSKFLVLGFLIMAGVSVILTFKQARAVDAMGDVAKVSSKIKELQREMQDKDLDKEDRSDLKDKIEELQEEDLPEQREDAMKAAAALPNGAVIWTFLSQVGVAIFGLGVLAVFMKDEEQPIVRATALIVIGSVVLGFIASRYIYLIASGTSGLGSLL